MTCVLKMVYGVTDVIVGVCARSVARISSRLIDDGGEFGRISQRNILQQPFLRDRCAAYVHVGTAGCCYTGVLINP